MGDEEEDKSEVNKEDDKGHNEANDEEEDDNEKATTRATTRTTMRTTTTRRRRRRRTNDGVCSIYADLRVVWRRLSHRLAIRQWRLLEASRAYQIRGNTSEVLPRSACLLIVIVSRA